MEAICDAEVPWTRILADFELPPADPIASGVVAMEVTTDLGPQGTPWAVNVEGPEVSLHVDTSALGGHDVCFDLLGFDATGRETWRDGPHCSEEPLTCPAEARDPSGEGAGCGCSGAPAKGGLGWAWWGLAAILLSRRRR